MADTTDRGITINRTLAWTMLVSVAERASSAQLEARVRVLETEAARQDVRFDALSASIDELKQQARQTNDLLRDLTQQP